MKKAGIVNDFRIWRDIFSFLFWITQTGAQEAEEGGAGYLLVHRIVKT